MAAQEDYAFNRQCVAYQTGRVSRTIRRIIRVRLNERTDSKNSHETKSLELEPWDDAPWSEEELTITNVES